MAVANGDGQLCITDFFDSTAISDLIDGDNSIREEMNVLCGLKENVSVKPILNSLLQNAERNSQSSCRRSNRHDNIIKKFASSLYCYCLIGRAGYEMLYSNLGNALPSLSTIQRTISDKRRIVEGTFYFDELLEHLQNGGPFVRAYSLG